MRRRLSYLLLGAGVAVWGGGVAAWISGVWVTLPPDAAKVLVLSIAALAGGGLLAAGAAIGRAAGPRGVGGEGSAAPAPAHLAAPAVEPLDVPRPVSVGERRP